MSEKRGPEPTAYRDESRLKGKKTVMPERIGTVSLNCRRDHWYLKYA